MGRDKAVLRFSFQLPRHSGLDQWNQSDRFPGQSSVYPLSLFVIGLLSSGKVCSLVCVMSLTHISTPTLHTTSETLLLVFYYLPLLLISASSFKFVSYNELLISSMSHGSISGPTLLFFSLIITFPNLTFYASLSARFYETQPFWHLFNQHCIYIRSAP